MNLTVAHFKRLGVDHKQVLAQPQITPTLRMIGRAIGRNGMRAKTWIEFLEASPDPEARKIVEAYYSVNRQDSDLLPIEAFCVAATVPTFRVLELITASVVRMGANSSTIIAAVNHPKVVKKTIEMALTDEGFEDRQVLHKATGFLPTPKGSQTNITVTQNSNPQVAVVAAPAPEQTIRRLADKFNAEKMLTATVQPEEEIVDED